MSFAAFLTNPATRFTRRLIFALLWLALLDPFVPPLLHRLEQQRYEGRSTFRFASSDLFGLGPFVSYLRDHPRGDGRRVVFFGNSMMFAYALESDESIPGQYERQQSGVRAFNAAINGETLATNYLIAKSIIGSVDVMYVQIAGDAANPMLPALIPVDEADARLFGITGPDPFERRLQTIAGRTWRLYASNARLQAAMFGTSTRNFLYRRIRDLPSPPPAHTWLDSGKPITLRVPRLSAVPSRSTRQQLLLRDFAELARSHQKRIVFLVFEHPGRHVDDSRFAALNAAYAPYAEVIVITIPPGRTYDGFHLMPAGCRDVAAALLQHERQR